MEFIMNKKEKTVKLNRLIKQEAPDWLTDEEYQLYTKKRSTLRANFEVVKHIEKIFGISLDGISPHPRWKSYSFSISPRLLVERYNSDELFSEPGSGQDPKEYSSTNLKITAYHGGRQWGSNIVVDENGNRTSSDSEWIESGTFNLVQYPSGKVVLEPCNVEHRLWGLIGFPLNIAPIDSKEDLWYYDDKLPEIYDEKNDVMVRGFKVNKMYLSDIVKECDKYGISVTESDILDRHFYKNNFNFTILPFYSKEDCENYFREVNTSSAKTRLQLHHAESSEIMDWWKSYSSPKCVNFKPMGCNYHPLIELLPDKEKVKLEGLAYIMLVSDFMSTDKTPVDSTDAKLIERYHHTNAYANMFDEDFKENVIDGLDYVYDLVSSSHKPVKLSRQMIQQLLTFRKYLDFNGYVLQDSISFMEEYVKYYKKAQEDDEGNMTPFGRNVRSGSRKNAENAFMTVRNDFLKKMTDIDYLESIGIVPQSESIKRIFSSEVINENLEDNDGKDVDGEELSTAPVGGHIISDMELIRMTDKERDEAFQQEGLGDKFDFDKNCRAMSSYHNQRMGVLRLSEYLLVINEPDSVVRARRGIKYDKLKAKVVTKAV